MMKTVLGSILAGLMALSVNLSDACAEDEEELELPDFAIYKAMLDANRKPGWVQFRDYSGRQLIYFTALQTMRCRLSAIRYSINSEALDRTFPLGPCDPQQPFNMPDDPDNKYVLIEEPAGSVRTLTIQVMWKDGSGSEIITYRPCDNVGESTCARIARVNKPTIQNAAPKQ